MLRDGIAVKDTSDGQGADEIHKIGVELEDESRGANVVNRREETFEDQRPRQGVAQRIVVIKRVT